MSQTGWIQLGLIFIPTNGWPGSGSWIRGWRCLCQRHRGVFVFKQGTPWEGKRHGGLVGSDSPAGWYLHVATGRSNCSMEDGEETNKPVSFGRAFVSKVMKHVKGLLVYLILGLLKIPTASLEESRDHCIFSKETTWSFNSICFPGDLWYRNHLVVVSGGFKDVLMFTSTLGHDSVWIHIYIYIYIWLLCFNCVEDTTYITVQSKDLNHFFQPLSPLAKPFASITLFPDPMTSYPINVDVCEKTRDYRILATSIKGCSSMMQFNWKGKNTRYSIFIYTYMSLILCQSFLPLTYRQLSFFGRPGSAGASPKP